MFGRKCLKDLEDHKLVSHSKMRRSSLTPIWLPQPFQVHINFVLFGSLGLIRCHQGGAVMLVK